MKTHVLAALVLLLAFAAPAQAHLDAMDQTKALVAGPYYLTLEPRPMTPYANMSTSFAVQVAPKTTGTPIRDDSVEVRILAGGPADFTERKTLASDGSGYFLTALSFPVAGVYSLRIIVKDHSTGEEHANTTEIEAFRDLPVRVRPVDTAMDVYAGQTTAFAFEVVDAIRLNRSEAVQDLSLQLAHWTDDHKVLLGEQELAATKAGTGTWRAEVKLGDAGMYHIRFASLSAGFNYVDTPPLHVYATPLEDTPASDAPARTPGPSVALVVLALGAALVLVSWRRR